MNNQWRLEYANDTDSEEAKREALRGFWQKQLGVEGKVKRGPRTVSRTNSQIIALAEEKAQAKWEELTDLVNGQFYEKALDNTLTDLFPEAKERISGFHASNKPFYLVGHSQGTLIVEQLSNWIDYEIQQGAEGFGQHQDRLYGVYQLSSMNWDIMSMSSGRGNHSTVDTDKMRVLANLRAKMLTGLELIPPNEFGYTSKQKAVGPFGSTVPDTLNHLISFYLGQEPEMDIRHNTRIESIRGNMLVCSGEEEEEEAPVCGDSDMAVWVANENHVIDDNFSLYIDDKYLSALDLDSSSCNGHLILPTDYSGASKSDIKYHPDFLMNIQGCMGAFKLDSSSRMFFSSNLPSTSENTSYEIDLINQRNNGHGNYGVLYAAQVCEDPVDGKPILRRILSSASYSGENGRDIGPFNFSTNQCLSCDDLGNTTEPSSPQNYVLDFQISGSGLCYGSIDVDGPTSFSRSVNSTQSGQTFTKSMFPGKYSINLSFNQSCGLGVGADTVGVSVSLDGQLLTGVGILNSSKNFEFGANPIGDNL